MSDHEAKQATPHATLLVELLDSRIPKSEREHAAAREIERLTAELETERMRLAACGVVALANTEQSAAKEREMLPEYRSASLADVERAVDREMQLRAERDELRRQLAEAEMDAERYRWLAGHCRSTSEHWGGRWSIIVDGPAPKAHDSEDAFDAAIDAAMRLTRPAEE